MAFGDDVTFGQGVYDDNPFSMGFGLGSEQSDNYTDPNAPEAWQNSQEGKGAWQNQGSGLATYGLNQGKLGNLWNNAQGPEYAGAYDQMGQLGNTQKLLNNDWFVTKGADGSYGLMPKMNHGWNAEFASMIARVFGPMVFGDGGILSQGAGTGATEAGTELGASFGSDLGNNFDAFGGGFGLEGSSGTGFDAALNNLGSSAPALNYGADEFNDAGLDKYKTPETSSGGGIGGGINNGTQMQGGSGNASPEQTQLQRDFLKYAGNEVKPGLGNVAVAGDKAMSDGQGLWGTGLTGQDLLGGLQSLYGMYTNNKSYGQLQHNLSSMYGQNSPYAEELRKQLLRRDAASGRRSQYGPREVELQAKLAQQYSQNAPNLMNAMKANNVNKMAMASNLIGLGAKAIPALQKLWSTDEAPNNQQLSMPDFGQLPQGMNSFGSGFGLDTPQLQDNYFNVPQLGGGY